MDAAIMSPGLDRGRAQTAPDDFRYAWQELDPGVVLRSPEIRPTVLSGASLDQG